MIKKLITTWLLLTGAAFAACTGSSPTWNAGASQADMSTCQTNASAGDTINIATGSFNLSGFSFTKAVTWNGAGIGTTTITATGQNTFTKSSVGVMRFKNMTWNNGGLANSNYPWFITANGNWKSTYPIVFENMSFVTPWVTNHSGSDTTNNFRVEVAGGVIWANNTFACGWDCDFIQIKNPTDTDGSWTNNDTFGTRDQASTLTGTIAGTTGFLNHYIETNTFTGGSNQGIDCDDGCRMVVRNNTFTNSEVNSHGYDTSSFGERHSEIYSNTFNNTCSQATTQNQANCEEFGLGNSSTSNVSQQIWLRGGTHVIYSNNMENASNNWWGTKPQVRMNIRAVSQPQLIGLSCPPSYPVARQLGQSWTNGGRSTDPIYFWNNTVKVQGGSTAWDLAQINEAGTDWPNDSFCTSGINNFSNYFQSPRDVVNLTLKNGSAKPGYTAYTYPHPLVSGGGGPTQAATPTFNPVPGTYSTTQNVAITSTTSGATICYTIDASTPTANGAGTCTHGTTLTNGSSVSIASTTTLSAIASKSGNTDSNMQQGVYTIGGGGTWSYQTDCTGTENPISENGVWINGLQTGIKWGDVQKGGGACYGTTVTDGCSFQSGNCNDSTAVMTGTWNADQQSCGTVLLNTTGFSRNASFTEIELRVNTTITANSITGYEMNYSTHNASGSPYIQIVRWNGGLNNFTLLNSLTPTRVMTNGDTVCFSSNGSTLQATINGTNQFTGGNAVTDNTYNGGSPGMGFFNQNGTTGDNSHFGWSLFQAYGQTSTPNASTPSFSPVAGSYGSSQTITITSATSGATICETIDGSTPTADGAGTCTHGTTKTNGGTQVIASTATLKAIATKNGFNDSAVFSGLYTIGGAALNPPTNVQINVK